jgi:hypothetical protein
MLHCRLDKKIKSKRKISGGREQFEIVIKPNPAG